MNESLFIRKENIDGNEVFYVFVGSDNKMYKLNEPAYYFLMLLKENKKRHEISDLLKEKYVESTEEEIENEIDSLVKYFTDIHIILGGSNEY
ncbi:PqqD family peptide modification chaperone [Clostridium thermosuccinogenes]|uniref:PqqD family peptide modification chaperone n=1 Tax=Clostridium thermosuccinogenes TaxID=84032 RepID=UPI0013747D91|nr:PqqD family peptide modification chaperone [Pseudoclostridium thermosuccinogenes]